MTNTEEPRYTYDEWKQIQFNDSLVASVHGALVGRRITDIDTLWRVLKEIYTVSSIEKFSSFWNKVLDLKQEFKKEGAE